MLESEVGRQVLRATVERLELLVKRGRDRGFADPTAGLARDAAGLGGRSGLHEADAKLARS